MDGRDFFGRVHAHGHLEWLGCKEGRTPDEDEVLVRCKSTGARFAVSIDAIRDHAWEELAAVLTGARSPRIMTHVTRIVGYYSQLQNWNRSKLAELRDRHRGQYAVVEPARAPTPKPAPAVAERITSAVA